MVMGLAFVYKYIFYERLCVVVLKISRSSVLLMIRDATHGMMDELFDED